ncbi:Uncharacterized protein Fot_57140 [Forsythia ovata]|uniref:Uncharacterized protein n=1 Tax=Forsythia ovata TaxID=205694 RepID=A0ABD1NWL8_9LAMI
MKVISTPQFSGNGEMVEPDVLIITSGGLWIPVRSHIVVMVLCLLEECISWSSDYVADERRYSWLLERNNAQTSLLPTSDCAAGGYIHGGLKENNAKIVPLQNFEDVLGFLLTPVTNLTKSTSNEENEGNGSNCIASLIVCIISSSSISSSMVGHHSPAIPIPNTGPTPTKSSLTMAICPQTAGTLDLDTIDAAAPPNGGLVTGHSPIHLPPMDGQFEGFVTCQNLEPAILPSGQSGAPMPAPSGPSALAHSPPTADVQYSAPLTSSQLNVPAAEQPLPLADDSRTHTPALQAPSGASNQQAIGGVPGSVGLPLNQISESSKSLEAIAEDPSDANV